MGQRTWIIFSTIELACIIAVIGFSVGLGGCAQMVEGVSKSVPMKCHWSFIATTITGIAALAIAFVTLFAKGREARRVGAFSTLALLIATVVITTPLGIGICASPDMQCNQTALALWVSAGMGCVISVVELVKSDPDKATLPKMKL